jgi:branched-chain amino acid transport system permease protein
MTATSAAMPPASPAFRVTRQTALTRVAAAVGLGLVALLATLPAWGNAGTQKLLVELFTLLAMAQMWNLLAGYAGLVSIGQQAFIGLGAYSLFALTVLADLTVIPAIILGAALVGLVAALVAPLAFRLSGGYFAIGTWVIAEVIRLLVSQSRELGAGTGTTIQSLVGMPAAERQALTYWLALAVGAGSVVVVMLIMRTRVGLALAAVRDSEGAAASLGVDVRRAKLFVWLVAAVGCGIAGAVAYMQLLRIQPTAAFGVEWTATMIFVAIIGGLGRIEGPIVGVLVFFLLQETLADFGAAYLVILGTIAVLVTLFAPRGLWGLIEARAPVALFGVRRRLVVDPGAGPGPSRREEGPSA